MFETLTIFDDLMFARSDVFFAGAILVLLLIGALKKGNSFALVTSIAIIFLLSQAITLYINAFYKNAFFDQLFLFNDFVVYDNFGLFAKLLVYVATAGALLFAFYDLKGKTSEKFEYPILILLSALGMSVMISANNFLTLYIGLELQSLALYILAAFHRNNLNSSEAGLKYFILGALSSGILLFGISILYGYSGTTSYNLLSNIIGDAVTQDAIFPMAYIVGMVFVLTGIAFKISAVPFHMWTPDVYQGSPACVTGFFATAPKIAAFAVLTRLLFEPFSGLTAEWSQIIYALSLASMVIGAFGGLVQKNIYRLLAFSSIGHVGFILIGFLSETQQGINASMQYLTIYIVMTLAAFALILSLRDKDNVAIESLDDFAGLSVSSKFVSYGLALVLFSMAGIPPLAGFFAKFMVLNIAVQNGYMVLAVLAVITSVVSAYYYLNLIKVMFFDKAEEKTDFVAKPAFILKWVSVPTVAYLVFYIFTPNGLTVLVDKATQGF